MTTIIVPTNSSFYHLATNHNSRKWERNNNYSNKKHIFLHKNIKNFGNHQIEFYTKYQGGTKPRLIEFKTTRPLKLLNLSKKGYSNMFNVMNKLNPRPEIQYIKNLFQTFNPRVSRNSIYDRIRHPAVRHYIQNYIRETLLLHGYNGLYEGSPSYNSYLLLNVGKKIKFSKYINQKKEYSK